MIKEKRRYLYRICMGMFLSICLAGCGKSGKKEPVTLTARRNRRRRIREAAHIHLPPAEHMEAGAESSDASGGLAGIGKPREWM